MLAVDYEVVAVLCLNFMLKISAKLGYQ